MSLTMEKLRNLLEKWFLRNVFKDKVWIEWWEVFSFDMEILGKAWQVPAVSHHVSHVAVLCSYEETVAIGFWEVKISLTCKQIEDRMFEAKEKKKENSCEKYWREDIMCESKWYTVKFSMSEKTVFYSSTEHPRVRFSSEGVFIWFHVETDS